MLQSTVLFNESQCSSKFQYVSAVPINQPISGPGCYMYDNVSWSFNLLNGIGLFAVEGSPSGTGLPSSLPPPTPSPTQSPTSTPTIPPIQPPTQPPTTTPTSPPVSSAKWVLREYRNTCSTNSSSFVNAEAWQLGTCKSNPAGGYTMINELDGRLIESSCLWSNCCMFAFIMSPFFSFMYVCIYLLIYFYSLLPCVS